MSDEKSDTYNISGQDGATGPNAHPQKSEVNTKVTGDGNVAASGNISSSTVTTGQGNIVVTGGSVQIHQSAPVLPPPALHEMPSPSRDFVGREKEMEELLQALEQGGVTISGLQGMGGIGKTALALKLAEHLKPKYPDAQLYLDLKGASSHPLTAAEAMAHVIRAYHPEAKLPEEESSLRGLYLSVLENQKALLLMDNAASADQIEPLIPPLSCVLLVTSRTRFIVDGLFAKNLDTLEIEDAKQLLLTIAPRIGDCAAKIAELCGYLPLALRLAAGALHKLVMLAPEEYVQRLSNAQTRLELVDASLSLSYDLLSEQMQKLWRMLAVFPTTFDTSVVAALWELPVENVQDRLAELISRSLIEWSETTRRYWLHDLVRLLADARLEEQERLAARKAHAVHCRNLLAQANDFYLKGGAEILRGLVMFDLERENIKAGQSWSVSLIGKDDTATKLSLDYYSAGAYVLGLRLHYREQISWLEVSLQAARLLKDKQGEGAALGNLGLAYWYLGECRKAIEYQEQRLEIAREIGDRRGEGNALGNLGNAYGDLGEAQKSIEYFEQILIIYRETGDHRGEGQALGCLGIAYGDLGEARKAIEFYEQWLEIAREIGDRRNEGQALGSLGNAYANLGETRKAIKYHQQNVESAREIGDRRGEGIALWNSALDYKKLGNLAQAISLAEMALEIYQQIESPGISKARATLEKWKAEAK